MLIRTSGSRKNAGTPARRRGFTLVEVVVAILLIDIGFLALVGASAVLVRQVNEAHLRSAALTAATNRLQSLGAGACAATSGAAAGPHGIQEEWSVALLANHVRELRDTVTFVIGAERRGLMLRTRLPC